MSLKSEKRIRLYSHQMCGGVTLWSVCLTMEYRVCMEPPAASTTVVKMPLIKINGETFIFF